MRGIDREIRDRIEALRLTLSGGGGGARPPGAGAGGAGDAPGVGEWDVTGVANGGEGSRTVVGGGLRRPANAAGDNQIPGGKGGNLRSRDADGPGGRAGALSVHDIGESREVESHLGRCLVFERDVGGIVDPAGIRRAIGGLTRGGEGSGFIFLDLETTGFASTPLFLAGTMFLKDGRLCCTQLLARDYSEERALVGTLDRLIGDFGLCITFNGKSFDMPYLRDRARYHRMDLACAPAHLDLLHHARRKWRDRLPNCRLATLERHILGRQRGGDVPGWEVPCIYHEFVHTGDARRLVGVIRHNLLDVVSMAELLICLAEG